MADEVSAALNEIVVLLRQRVEQNAESVKRADERLARMPKPPVIPDFAEIEAKSEAKAAEHREAAAQLRAEDVAFRERLLKAIEDQNVLIRTLLERTAGPGPR